MYGPRTTRRRVDFGIGPVPKDLLILLGILFLTYTLDAFRATGWVNEVLQLSPAVWQWGFLWQLVTYPLAEDFNGIWFLVVGFMVLQFGGQIFRVLGRKAFWRLLIVASGVAGVAASLVQIVIGFLPLQAGGVRPFFMMQGAEMVLVILIAAFATLFRSATIHLFFILPMQAGWFLWLEILIAFIAFLATKDFAGFVGITTAVGVTYVMVSGKGWKGWLRELKLRAERKVLEAKLKRMQGKARKSLRSEDSEDDDENVHKGPWVN